MNKYQTIGALLLLMSMVGMPSLAWSEEQTLATSTEDKPLASTDMWSRHETALDLHLGVATPQGALGVSVTKLLDRNFALSASAGLGFTGPHLSLMPRVQVTGDAWALGVGAGMTAATYSEEKSDISIGYDSDGGNSHIYGYKEADLVLWGNVEAYVLFLKNDSGFRYGGYLGLTNLLLASGGESVVRGESLNGSEISRDSVVSSAFVDGIKYTYLGVYVGHVF